MRIDTLIGLLEDIKSSYGSDVEILCNDVQGYDFDLGVITKDDDNDKLHFINLEYLQEI